MLTQSDTKAALLHACPRRSDVSAHQNLSHTRRLSSLYELRTKFRLGGPIGDYIGSWEGPVKGYTTNLAQGSY